MTERDRSAASGGPARADGVGGAAGAGALRRLGRAALDRLRILTGREPPDSRYARLHARAVRRSCARALRGRRDWLLAVAGPDDCPAFDERVVELPWVYGHLGRAGRLLDVGSTLNAAPHIRLLRSRFEEVTFLNPYRDDGFRSPAAGVAYVTRDARDPGLAPGSFERITCISTLEHVGCDNTRYGGPARTGEAQDLARARADALRALRRLLAPGGTLLLTVPYGRLEDHGWFIQLDAGALAEAVAAFAPAVAETAFFRFEGGWQPASAAQCGDARYGDRTRGASAVACAALGV